MAYCGRSLVLINSGGYLHLRNYLGCCYQSVSTKSTKSVDGQISPLKPKKPISSFLLFLNDVRGKYKEEKPNWSAAEIAKRASADWAEMSSEKKQEYKNKFSENFERYLKDMDEYKKCGFIEQTEKEIKKQKRLKNRPVGKPKKPLSSFMLYFTSNCQSRDMTLSYKEWLKMQADNWKKMTEADKKEYVTRSESLMEEYKRNMENWKQNMINLDHSETVKKKLVESDEK